MRRFTFARFCLGLALLALLPGVALAQSTIAGIVRDTSGAILPGVTVEAASPVLIEKVRSAVTDGDGRYSIVALRPGTYDVTFTLTGFSTFKRDGILVPADTTVPVNADLRVGSLEETVTVSGESPVVDVQNTARQQVLTRDLMDSIPSARNIQSVGALVAGIRLNIPDVGGSQQTEQTYMAAHGNTELHTTILLDGMPAQTNLSDGAVQNYIDNALIAEATYQTGGVSAETSAGGVRLNLIPKDGGNTLRGSGFLAGSSDNWHLQSTNLDDSLAGARAADWSACRTSQRLQWLGRRPGRQGQAVVVRLGAPPGHVRANTEFVQERRLAGDRGCLDQQLRRSRDLAGNAAQQACRHLPAQLQVEGSRDQRGRSGRRAHLQRTIVGLPPAGPLLHRASQVDHPDHESTADGGRLLGRYPALLGRVPAGNRAGAWHGGVDRQRVTTRHHHRRHTGPHRRRTNQSIEHARPTLRRRVGLLRDRHTQHQDGHALGLGKQPVGARHERRPLSDLPGRHAGQWRVHARPPGAGSCLQHADYAVA